MMISPISMAGWTSNNPKLNPKAVDGNEMLKGLNLTPVSHKSFGLDLIQNCDLPPPMKVFTGSDNKTVLSSMNRACSMSMTQEDDNRDEFDMCGNRGDGGENEKLELLKALRLSQTRAREAEKKAEKLGKEKDCLSDALLAEARELFAYRQWVRLLELKVSKLESQWAEQEEEGSFLGGRSKGLEEQSVKEGDEGENGDGISWIVALALCFGIAGVGFAFGCRYLC
ncbi:PREDICTED: transmembrane [Prunus dulcis]|uniref:PREDICTED: transmembrane n=1 Tax=Prunus dulcis TaxID=3755 RepID=A0A5E4G637_PRUDU|nr:uncharacterized protein LOC117631844 [Prunus dulcis]VVA35186.1 PREDICTED: transmembrane [Prunus dulcis]